MVELVTAAGILAVLMLASAAAMGGSVDSTNDSRSMTRGAMLLESVQEDLAALDSNALLSMNGQAVYSSDDWGNALHRVEITVFSAGTNIVQFAVDLVDQRTGRVLATVHGRRALV